MNTTTFVLWLLLSMYTDGHVYLKGQFWSEAACNQEKRSYSRRADETQQPLNFVCQKVVIAPDPLRDEGRFAK